MCRNGTPKVQVLAGDGSKVFVEFFFGMGKECIGHSLEDYPAERSTEEIFFNGLYAENTLDNADCEKRMLPCNSANFRKGMRRRTVANIPAHAKLVYWISLCPWCGAPLRSLGECERIARDKQELGGKRQWSK